ncbi:hypothetical protein HGRIS_008291 [Hohenbuehelia grisea]|uniref:BAR-domain-containing protein n=1 Tax=Hohenbuehelia grisea TaxID=104357 RepID=A0ABR3J8F2_9AGAR
MASKQLGKLRQWAGEVISSRDRTTFSDEFKALEKDIEVRKVGAQRVLIATEDYHHALSKKKECAGLDDPEKLLPIDALGIVMIIGGEEFGETSPYGATLVKLGRAHCKIATIQEAFALTLQDTFLASIQKFEDDIKEYEAHRKRLESRRLSYDAAATKFEKLAKSKKDKDRRDADEESERAKQRYEETLEDVRAHMQAIQESEVDQQRELSAFLDLEINFVEQYLSVLKDARADWPPSPNAGASRGPRAFPLANSMSKSPSIRSKRSARSERRLSAAGSDVSDTEAPRRIPPALSRRSSQHNRSESKASNPPSRPSSRASRKRADSNVSEKEVEKSRKMSVTGWATSAVGSFSGRGKKNRDQFASLDDDRDKGSDAEEEEVESRTRSRTQSFTSRLGRIKPKDNGSSPAKTKPVKPPSPQPKKFVRALYDFNGSSDELSFKTGDEILILNEVLDEWWMGQLEGRKGLFPTSYTEVMAPKPQAKPPLPQRNNSKPIMSRTSSFSSGDDQSKDMLLDSRRDTSESELEEEHHTGPMAPHESPFYLPGDAASITSSGPEDDSTHDLNQETPTIHSKIPSTVDDRKILQPLNPPRSLPPPIMARAATTDNVPSSRCANGKRAPPPPPPPRRSTGGAQYGPPIPERKPTLGARSQSFGGPPKLTTPASSVSSHGYDVSPFESSSELSAATGNGCTQFKQNPFKPQGMCNNCFEMHADA